MKLVDTVYKCYENLRNLGTKSDADGLLLFAYLSLWVRTGEPVHVDHFIDPETKEEVFIAKFSQSKEKK